jgi:hypothetical protein
MTELLQEIEREGLVRLFEKSRNFFGKCAELSETKNLRSHCEKLLGRSVFS